MKLRVISLTFALVALACGSAMAQSGGTIGVYADLLGTSCEITAPAYAQTPFYILAKPNIANTDGGVNAAEFRVKGAPSSADIVLTPTANPASNVTLGSPFSDESLPEGTRGGTNIAFPACQTVPADGVVLLYTIVAINLTGVTDVVFEVDAKDPPSNPSNNYPLINACDGPIFTAVSVTPGTAYLNHTSAGQCEPVVAIQEKTWGEVKHLYN